MGGQHAGALPLDLVTLRQQRWFAGKGRTLREAHLVDTIPFGKGRPGRLELYDLSYAEGAPERYVLVRGGDEIDALADPDVARALRDLSLSSEVIPSREGARLVFWRTDASQALVADAGMRVEPPKLMLGEQSNTSIRFGDSLIMKVFRRIQPGEHPDLEIGRVLADRTSFRGVPLLAGGFEYVDSQGQPFAVGMLQEFAPNRGDAWSTLLERLRQVAAANAEVESAVAPMRRLGTVTGELHVALASLSDPAFAPERIDATDVASWEHAILAEVAAAVDGLEQRELGATESDTAATAHQPASGHSPESPPRSLALGADPAAMRKRASGIRLLEGALKIRHHGDYHLGQVLEREDGTFAIVDFEGEPSKPLAVRREKRSPLRDVAGMLRSFDYARHTVLRERGAGDEQARACLVEWHTQVREAYLGAFLLVMRGAAPDLLPADNGRLRAALSALELEKAAYEVLYELQNRPTWLPIPLAAFTASA